MHKITYLKLLTVAFIWGGTFITTRIAAQVMGPFEGAFLRFLFAAAGLLLVTFVFTPSSSRPKFKRENLWLTVGLAFSGIIAYNFFFFNALRLVPASRASLLVALNPVIILFTSAFIYKEPLRWTKIVGALLALAGAATVISRGNISQLFTGLGTGEYYAMGCPITWAIYTILNRQLAGRQTALESTFFSCLIGIIGLLPLALWEGFDLSAITLEAWLSLAYLGIMGTTLGFVWYADGISQIGATRTAIFNNLVPVFGVLLSVLLLNEQIGWPVFAGGALVVAGVAFINFL